MCLYNYCPQLYNSEMFAKKASIALLTIHGPITITKQFQLLKTISYLYTRPWDAIAVHISSYGGTMRSAIQIADALKKYRYDKQTPVYCFAQDFCMNSANVILTVGTKAFASKFTVMGDFGFNGQFFDFSANEQAKNISLTPNISYPKSTQVTLGPADTVRFGDKQNMQKFLDFQTRQLQNQLISNRLPHLQLKTGLKGEKLAKHLQQNLFNTAVLNPYTAQQLGFIDKVDISFNYLRDNFQKYKVHDLNGLLFQYEIMNTAARMFQKYSYKDF